MNSDLGGKLYVLAAGLCWGTTGTAQALAPAGADPQSVGAVRLMLGGLALFLFALSRGGLMASIRKLPIIPLLVAAGCMALYQVFFFAAVRNAGVAMGTTITIGSFPIFTGLLNWVITKKSAGPRWMAGTLLAIAGCTLLTLNGLEHGPKLLGVFQALAAGFVTALYTICSKRLLDKAGPEQVAAAVFALGGLMLLPVFLAGDASWLYSFRGVMAALELGLVATALAYILFLRGLSRVGSPTAATLALSEPMFAACLGIFLLGESLHPMQYLGLLLVLMGLAIITINPATILRGNRPKARQSNG